MRFRPALVRDRFHAAADADWMLLRPPASVKGPEAAAHKVAALSAELDS
ncbi:hypothetical protein ABTX34_35205 [Streptomyces sp. NPDC096538]